MDLKQLTYFTAIAEAGSVSEAARRLHMSQPPLSYQLKMLEEELGVVLFERGSRSMTLTEAGRLLYAHSRTILNYADSAKREVHEAGEKKVLRLGVTTSTIGILTDLIGRYAKAHPEVMFEIHDGSTYQLLEKLENHVIEGTIVRTPCNLSGLSVIEIQKEPMMAASIEPLNKNIKLKDLSDKKLLLYRRYYEFLMDAFHKQNLNPEVFALSDDARDCVQLAEKGLGTAIIPSSMKNMCGTLNLSILKEPSLTTGVLFARREDHDPSPALVEWMELLSS